MKKSSIASILVFALLLGCAISPSTGEPGIVYGMTKNDVIQKLNDKSNEVISISNTKIIAVGNWELTNQIRKKVFYFKENKLVRVSYEPADEQ